MEVESRLPSSYTAGLGRQFAGEEAAAMSRFAHLVGSIPLGSPEEAMTAALERLGPHLRWLPDGETGERRNWIVHIIDSFREHPDLELAREGRWTDYDDVPRFRIRRGHSLSAESLDFGHVAAFERSFPTFLELRERYGREDLAFQLGIPGDFDLALFTLGPLGAFRHRAAFTDATVAAIRTVHEQAGGDVVFQVEVPAELVFVAKTPPPVRQPMAAYLARGITALAAAAPRGARFGVHLCVGDMEHRALGRMRDVAPMVDLANGIAKAWPAGRLLEFVHAPFAAAVEPPPNQRRFYSPLQDLRLPAGVEFVAGFVHEAHPLHAQQALRDHLDALVGDPVAVATACGLGRRAAEPALATMERAAALCEAPTTIRRT